MKPGSSHTWTPQATWWAVAAAAAGERTLILGSHQDTVVEGGKYDGMLGVALPLMALKTLREQGVELPYGIQVVPSAMKRARVSSRP